MRWRCSGHGPDSHAALPATEGKKGGIVRGSGRGRRGMSVRGMGRGRVRGGLREEVRIGLRMSYGDGDGSTLGGMGELKSSRIAVHYY